jgi:glycosyltransferase involved in cell wall biosynthesis
MSELTKPINVSAIIPTFNRLGYIQRAVDSVLAQTVPVDEVLVIDDGSTDGTAEALIAEYGERIRIVRQANTGVSGARRRGVEEARGEWIAFLDSDDEWAPDRNKELLEAAAKVPADVAWIFGDVRIRTDEGDNGTIFETFGNGFSGTEWPQIFPDSSIIRYPFQFGFLESSFIRRKVLLELDIFREGLRTNEDLLAAFQVACRYPFAAIPSVVGTWYQTSDLNASSLQFNNASHPDFFRARMTAFRFVIESGRWRPWNRFYASAVCGLCKALARRGQPAPRRLALQQFRFGGFTVKGVAFFCAAMLGRRGIGLWNRVADFRRKDVAT